MEPGLALITPSASPPRSRIPEQPSPTKRPRLASLAPRQVLQRASSVSTDTINFHKAREESALRLLNVWSGLAERYSRPLDEDDIIDLATGKVVQDRGVLRNSQTCIVGAFADSGADDAEDALEEEEEEEEEVDELDSFAPSTLRLDEGKARVALLSEPSAQDAQDLQEFLEAEQQRKEIYGDDVHETDGSLYEDDAVDGSASERFSESGYAESERFSESVYSASERFSEPVYVDSGSEDELGAWEVTEGSIIYRVSKDEEEYSEDELVPRTQTPPLSPAVLLPLSPEVPPPPWTNPLPTKNTKNTSFSNRQLQTPPKSQSSLTPTSQSSPPLLPTSSPSRSSPSYTQYDLSPTKPIRRDLQKYENPISDHKKHSDSVPFLDLTKSDTECSIKPRHPAARKHSTRESEKLAKPTKTPLVEKSGSTARSKGKQKATSFDNQIPKENLNDDTLSMRRSPSPQKSSKPSRYPSHQLSSSMNPIKSRTNPTPEIVASSSKKAPKQTLQAQTTPATVPGKKRKRIVSSADVVEDAKSVSPVPSPEDIRSRSRNPSQSRRRSSDASNKSEVSEEYISKPQRRGNRNQPPRQRSPSHSGSESSEEEEVQHGQRRPSRAPSHHPAPSQYYPFPQPLYPHPPSHTPPDQQQPIYTPLQDPRVHHIFTQAMQQIFALGSTTWGPPPPTPHGHQTRGSTPFTPVHHHRRQYRHGHTELSQPPPPLPPIYSTPVHHSHPYPYSYDPMLSNGTLPPSSPEPPSSSPGMSASNRHRRKSIVKRSQSRGRHVSFMDEKGEGSESDDDPLADLDAHARRRSKGRLMVEEDQPRHEGGRRAMGAKKETKKPQVASELEPEPEPERSLESRRSETSTRHRTPGPPSPAPVQNQSLVRKDLSPERKRRGRPRGS
ncbi:hypothetical protein H0H93_006694 [Arthromyces matolae]|nr:hypothetical protein H0H93_006694 [Arthromyces matolae]